MTIDRDRLLALFDIDYETGRFFWKVQPTVPGPPLVGKEAGCVCKKTHSRKGYWCIGIDGRLYKRSRLMFMAVHGRFPEPTVDHANKDSLDDRPSNLREATLSQNTWNRSTRRSDDLPAGVRPSPHGRYVARIKHRNQEYYLGTFDTPEDAAAMYAAKRKELFGEFA